MYHERAGFHNVVDNGMRHQPLMHCWPVPAEAPCDQPCDQPCDTAHHTGFLLGHRRVVQLLALVPTFHLVFAAYGVGFSVHWQVATGRHLTVGSAG